MLLAIPLLAQQKTPNPNPPKTEPKQEAVKFVEYQLTDIQKLQIENVQKDWKIALQQFYIMGEGFKKQNKWPDAVTCNIETLKCIGPEQKVESKEEIKKEEKK